MKYKDIRQRIFFFVFGVTILFCGVGYAENIDPNNDDSQYAYGENVGWLNAEAGGDGQDGAEVAEFYLTGFIWAENIGWINLSPTTYGEVLNDGNGNLSGYAWGENVGWINFNPTGGGVTIDSSGNFNGWAWGENIGWIHFNNPSVPYKVQTAWTSPLTPPAPDIKANGEDGPLTISKAAENLVITISLDPGDYGGTYADWWMRALRQSKGDTWWYVNGTGWVKSITPLRAHGGKLRSLAPLELWNGTIPVDTWIFHFAVDTDKNNVLDLGPFYGDKVKVTVNP